VSDFSDILKGVDPKKLEKGMEQAAVFAKTAQGKALIEKLKGNMPKDKDALMQMLEQNPDLIQSVESFFKK